MPVRNKEQHRTQRIGWLRAAVLGANDGIVSTASLVLMEENDSETGEHTARAESAAGQLLFVCPE